MVGCRFGSINTQASKKIIAQNKKTTRNQMELMVAFLEKNSIIVTGKTHPLNLELDRKWDELNLPSVSFPSFLLIKNLKQKKARLNFKIIFQTRGWGQIRKDLKNIENRPVSVFGWSHIIGCPWTPEEEYPVLGEVDLGHDKIHEEIPEPATEVQNFYDYNNYYKWEGCRNKCSESSCIGISFIANNKIHLYLVVIVITKEWELIYICHINLLICFLFFIKPLQVLIFKQLLNHLTFHKSSLGKVIIICKKTSIKFWMKIWMFKINLVFLKVRVSLRFNIV